MRKTNHCILTMGFALIASGSLSAQTRVDNHSLNEDEDDTVQHAPALPSSVFDDDGEPSSKVSWAGYDLTWQNGADRRDHAVLQTKYFTGSFMLDAAYTYSFNNPIDNTVVGSTALARNNETAGFLRRLWWRLLL